MKLVMIASVPESIISFRGNLIQNMLRKVEEVHIIAPFKDTDAQTITTLKEWGVKIHYIKLDKSIISFLGDFLYFINLFKILKNIMPDIVFAYTIKPVIYGSIISGILGVKKVYSLITGLGSNFIGRRNIFTFFLIFLYRYAMKKNYKVFFQNIDDRNYFIKNKIIESDMKCIVVNGSGVDLNYYYFSELPKKNSILLIARLIKNKGIYEYAKAAKLLKNEYPDIDFILAGDFEENIDSIEKKDLDEWIANDIIQYLGPLNDVRCAIQDCTVYVLPSYREGTPRSVLEAMSMGRAIVTCDTPGCRETVKENENGFLVPPKNPEAIYKAIKTLIEDYNLCKSFGLKSREMAINKYDQEKISSHIIKGMSL